MDEDLPQRDPAKVEALANAVREMATRMRAEDMVKALASVITAIVASLSYEMMIAVNQVERPGWPACRGNKNDGGAGPYRGMGDG